MPTLELAGLCCYYAYSLLKDVGQVCRDVLMLYVYMCVRVYVDVWYICMHMRALQCILRRAGGIG